MAPAPRRILYVLNSPTTGGANRSLCVLLAGLDRARFSPQVVVPRPGPLLDRLQALDVPVHILPLPSLGRLKASLTGKLKATVRNGRNVLRLARLLRRDRIDLVHTNTIFPLGGALAARLAGVPHVWHLREGMDTPEYDLRFGPALSRQMVGWLSQALICISKYVQKTSVAASSVGRSQVIFNALEQLPDTNVRAVGTPVTVGCVGLIGCKKRTRLFVETAIQMAAERDDIRFVVAGRAVAGEEGVIDACRRRVEEHGLTSRFEWPGFVADPADVYQRLDLLIHPGVHEAFGRVLIEAMSWGVPVVSVASGAIAEVIQDGQTGRVVPPDTAAALAAAALDVLRDAQAYRRMSRAALDDVRTRFTAARHVQRITALYDGIPG